MTRELLQQALDALQWHYDRGYPDSPTDEPRKRDARAIRAIRDHLAAPQPEPVTVAQQNRVDLSGIGGGGNG